MITWWIEDRGYGGQLFINVGHGTSERVNALIMWWHGWSMQAHSLFDLHYWVKSCSFVGTEGSFALQPACFFYRKAENSGWAHGDAWPVDCTKLISSLAHMVVMTGNITEVNRWRTNNSRIEINLMLRTQKVTRQVNVQLCCVVARNSASASPAVKGVGPWSFLASKNF